MEPFKQLVKNLHPFKKKLPKTYRKKTRHKRELPNYLRYLWIYMKRMDFAIKQINLKNVRFSVVNRVIED